MPSTFGIALQAMCREPVRRRTCAAPLAAFSRHLLLHRFPWVTFRPVANRKPSSIAVATFSRPSYWLLIQPLPKAHGTSRGGKDFYSNLREGRTQGKGKLLILALLLSTSKVDTFFFLSSQAALKYRLPTNPLQLSYLAEAQTVFSPPESFRSFSHSIQSGALER